MSGDIGTFPKLQLKQYAKVQERETSEARYWKAFNSIKEHKFQSSPNCIHFNPINPAVFIATASVKVSLFDGLSDKIQRSYSRFSNDAFSGKFRHDGKLIVAGEKTGVVKVFEVQNKSLLRQMKHHTSAVRSVAWTIDGINILSASDDKKVFRWDLATEELLWSSGQYHTDYVRKVEAHPTSADLFISGSYDHTVKLWDCRQKEPVMTFQHSNPIESIMFAPSGGMIITGSGVEVKLWDILSGGRVLHTFDNHQKNVTGLSMNTAANRILSCALDGHVKIYNLETLQVVHGMKFNAPLVSLALAPDDKKLVLGFVDGNLMIRRNKKTLPDEAESAAGLGTNLPFSISGPSGNSDELDPFAAFSASIRQIHESQKIGRMANEHRLLKDQVIIETERNKRLQSYEKHLKKFNYQKALDSALAAQNPIIVLTVIEELCRRNGLRIALSGRDEITLEPLMAFLAKYICHPRYASLVIQTAHQVLDIYANMLGQSEIIDDLVEKLRKQVLNEVQIQRDLERIVGSIDCIINVATMPAKKKRKIEEISDEVPGNPTEN